MSARIIDKHATAIRWSAALVLIIALILVVQGLPIQTGIQGLANWIDRIGMWGPILYGVLYVAATVLFVPGSIPTLAAGAMFGLWVGLVTVSVASTAGAMLAFLIARYLARGKVAAVARRYPRFGAIDRAIAEGGWRIVALLRLSPAVPFNLQNYLYGLTQIRFWPCLLATWLAMLPGTFVYVYIGHIAGTAVAAEREQTLGEWAVLAVGLLATVAATVYITRLARRKLAERPEVESDAQFLETDRQSENARPSRWQTWTLVAGALLAAAGAVAAQLHRDAIAAWLSAG